MDNKYLTFKEVVESQINNYISIHEDNMNKIINYGLENSYKMTVYLDNDLKEYLGTDKINYIDFEEEILNSFYIGYENFKVNPEKIIKNGSLTLLKIETEVTTEYFLLVTFGNDWDYLITNFTMEDL